MADEIEDIRNLPVLRQMYMALHRPAEYWTASGEMKKRVILPEELINQYGPADGNPSDVAATASQLEAWETKAKNYILEDNLTSLANRPDTKEFGPSRTVLVSYNIVGPPEAAGDVCPDQKQQLQTNIDALRGIFCWFRGNGKQPKWRVAIKNHALGGRQISGRAGPPWNVINGHA